MTKLGFLMLVMLGPVAAQAQGVQRAGVISDPFAWYKGSDLALKLMNRSAIGARDVIDRTSAGYGYNELILNLKLNDTISAQLHQPFGLAYRGRNTTSTHIERKDLQFWWDNTDVARLRGAKVAVSLRYNAPTGDDTFANHARLGVAHAEIGINSDVARGLNVAYTVHPHYYLNTRSAEITVNENLYKVEGNPDTQLVNRLQAKYTFNSQWAVIQHVMLDQTWSRPVRAFTVGQQQIDEIRGARKQELQVGTMVAFAPNRHLYLEAGVENKHNMDDVREDRDSLQLYHQAKNTYVLSTTVTF